MRWWKLIAAFIAATLSVCAPASAADVKFSALGNAGALTGAEFMIGLQGSGCAASGTPCANVLVSPAQLVTYADGTIGTALGRSLLNGATAASVRGTLGAAAAGANSDINVLSGLTTPLSISQGGTGAISASLARSALGSAAAGANADINSLSGLTTPLSISQGGTGATTASAALGNLGGQPAAPNLALLAGLSNTAGQIPLFNGSGTASTISTGYWRISAPIQSGQYIAPEGFGGLLTAGVAPGAGSMRMFLGYIRQPITITGVVVRVNTVSASGNVQVAVYAMDATSGWPTGSPLLISVSLSTGTVASVADTTVSAAVPAGWYWFATNCDNATAAFNSLSTTGAALSLSGAISPTGAFSATGISKTQTFGSWPILTGNRTTDGEVDVATASIPLVMFKR